MTHTPAPALTPVCPAAFSIQPACLTFLFCLSGPSAVHPLFSPAARLALSASSFLPEPTILLTCLSLCVCQVEYQCIIDEAALFSLAICRSAAYSEAVVLISPVQSACQAWFPSLVSHCLKSSYFSYPALQIRLKLPHNIIYSGVVGLTFHGVSSEPKHGAHGILRVPFVHPCAPCFFRPCFVAYSNNTCVPKTPEMCSQFL